MRKTLFVLFLAGASLSFALPHAVEAQPLAVSLEAYKVTVTGEGREAFALADKALPGEVIEYRATYANTSDRNLTSVAPEMPIPAGVTWLADANAPAAAAPVAASLDGKTFSALPLRDNAGRPVAPALIRALRWSVPEIKAGKAITISVRVSVNQTLTNTESATR